MRVEIIDDTEGRGPARPDFPPGGNYVDLRENPHAVERMRRQGNTCRFALSLRPVNSAESSFSSASASIQADSPATVSAGDAYEFASQARLVFVEPSLNFERDRYVDLTAGLRDLLERDSGDAIRAVLRIGPAIFPPRTIVASV